MSVTFSIDAVLTNIYTGECWADANNSPVEVFRVEGHDSALAAREAHKAVCVECDAYGIASIPVFDVEGGEVNISNRNAYSLGAVLGFDFGDELCGESDASVFLGYILPVLANAPEAIPAYSYQKEGAHRETDCGFDAENYLSRLADLCVEADRLGRRVVWS